MDATKIRSKELYVTLFSALILTKSNIKEILESDSIPTRLFAKFKNANNKIISSMPPKNEEIQVNKK